MARLVGVRWGGLEEGERQGGRVAGEVAGDVDAAAAAADYGDLGFCC